MSFLTGFESFVGVNFWTCLFTLLNLLILYKFMKKLLFKPVKNMIDARQQEIDDQYADAEKSKTEAAELKEQYQARLAAANAESEEILKEAHRRATLRGEEIIRDAQEKAAHTIRRADAQIEMEKHRAMNDIKDEVTGMAVEIAAAVLARDVNADEHSAFIDAFIDNLGENHD